MECTLHESRMDRYVLAITNFLLCAKCALSGESRPNRMSTRCNRVCTASGFTWQENGKSSSTFFSKVLSSFISFGVCFFVPVLMTVSSWFFRLTNTSWNKSDIVWEYDKVIHRTICKKTDHLLGIHAHA